MSAAYDARRDKAVLFGSGELLWETGGYWNLAPTIWEWDASQGWVARTVTFPATLAPWVRMHFDAHRGTLIAFMANTPLPYERVFEWDGGSAWQELVPVGPHPNSGFIGSFANGYDALRGHLVVLRNLNNLWTGYTFENLRPAGFYPHGAGCAGSLGPSRLALRHPWTRAWLDRSLEVELSNLPQSIGVLVLGWSDQQHGGITLPAHLDWLGMPGCHARVSFDSIHPVAGSSGRAHLALPIPLESSLIGSVFYQQGYAIDPGANALGLTASNSVRITIGRL